MDLETKPLARDSLRSLIDATRDTARDSRPHARVIPRSQARRHVETVREPSAMRGLIFLFLIGLGVRTIVMWVF